MCIMGYWQELMSAAGVIDDKRGQHVEKDCDKPVVVESMSRRARMREIAELHMPFVEPTGDDDGCALKELKIADIAAGRADAFKLMEARATELEAAAKRYINRADDHLADAEKCFDWADRDLRAAAELRAFIASIGEGDR